MKTKYIFITGGVVSALGKGISAASIGAILESRGLKLSMVKLDPYINVDPGTMSPFQHGEVFVTEDGTEADLDLGHYERFTHVETGTKSNFTSGQVYDTVIQKERRGEYLGKTVQVIPHITDQIAENIIESTKGSDVALVEIGGTVGDIESLPFLEAIRQFRHKYKRHEVLYIHLTLIPYIKAAGELKTKPTQHSVNKLREIGIQPDILICRTDQDLEEDLKQKLALFTNVASDAVITAKDCDCVYEIPLLFQQQGLDEKICDEMQLWTRKPNLQVWADYVDAFKNPKDEVTIAMIGKYATLKDSYKSLNEALAHAATTSKLKLNLKHVNSEEITEENVAEALKGCDGVLIPGGFGERGVEGKVEVIRYARENNLPFYGICLGMQTAVIEYARNVLGIKNASSAEFTPNGSDNVIDVMLEQKDIKEMGGTMRLGAYTTALKSGSKTAEIYGSETISERHRHRYEVNNAYVAQLEENGLVIAGKHPEKDLVEVVELSEHPFFIAVQYHPEFKSKPTDPHPLFKGFIEASYKNKEAKK